MAAHSVIHPSPDSLRAFALGKMDATSAGVLIDHLDQCPECCKVVAALSGDGFLERIRQAHDQIATPTPVKPPPLPKPVNSSPKSPTPLSDLPPELVGHPQYEILRELGRGGMGVVYLAKNKLMDRLEVLKVVNKALLDRPSAVERFLREIRSAAKLSHANVVGAYSALQVGDLLAFAMEYVEGEDLAIVVDKHGPLPIAHACYYVQQAALGLQHAFEKGMVHRDIKPQNLILARVGKGHLVKILDFGLAKVVREKAEDTGLTGAGKMMGTPDYMAPEQSMDAARADIRADIYSLGCTLYHLLAGVPPFEGRSLYQVLHAHQSLEATPLNLMRPEVPEALAAVVAKMMAKEPDQRYQTPIEVARALDPIVKGALKPSPPQAAAPQSVQRVAASRSLLNGETMLVDRASRVRTRKPAGAMRSRKWLAVSLAVVLLAGLFGLIWVASGKPLSSEKVAIQKTTLRTPAVKSPAKTVKNSMGMKFAWCPPGEFQMGSPPGEEKRSDDETQHKVTLSKGFYLGIHEVTQAQWRAVMGNNPSKFKGDDLPVETVSWEDCQEFCTKLGQRDGKRYRLPTEAEWEYACRAGTSTPFSFGETLGTDQANYDGNFTYGQGQKGVNREKTTPVGSFPANAWGLFDMHGNVWEWCQDWYGPYQKEDIKDPLGSNNGTARVLRGGSWVVNPGRCRAAYRNGFAPGLRHYSAGCWVIFCLD